MELRLRNRQSRKKDQVADDQDKTAGKDTPSQEGDELKADAPSTMESTFESGKKLLMKKERDVFVTAGLLLLLILLLMYIFSYLIGVA